MRFHVCFPLPSNMFEQVEYINRFETLRPWYKAEIPELPPNR